MAIQLEVGNYYKFSHPREWFVVEVLSKKWDVYTLQVIDSNTLKVGSNIKTTSSSPVFVNYEVEKYIEPDEIDYKGKPHLFDLHVNMALDSNDQEWLVQLATLKKEGAL